MTSSSAPLRIVSCHAPILLQNLSEDTLCHATSEAAPSSVCSRQIDDEVATEENPVVGRLQDFHLMFRSRCNP